MELINLFIVLIILSLIIYTFLRNILNLFNLKTGLINYIIFSSKIWFVSSPFIGLEITILRYFQELEIYKTPLIISIVKLILFIFCGLILHFKYPSNCLIYAKPISDICLLFYYTKICFELTLKEKYHDITK